LSKRKKKDPFKEFDDAVKLEGLEEFEKFDNFGKIELEFEDD